MGEIALARTSGYWAKKRSLAVVVTLGACRRLSVLRNSAIVADDPVTSLRSTGAGTIAAAPTRPSRHQHRRRSRAQSSAPEFANNNSAKKNIDVGQQPQRRAAGRCRSVGVRARWNWRLPRARVRAANMVNAASRSQAPQMRRLFQSWAIAGPAPMASEFQPFGFSAFQDLINSS